VYTASQAPELGGGQEWDPAFTVQECGGDEGFAVTTTYLLKQISREPD